jgi:4-amino-4-deoxy-L-arabinose transferase-like glycosyltransferase
MLFPTEILSGAIQLLNGRLILEGATIHQDFWSKETPLVFYLNSWAFRFLGQSVIAAKIVSIAIYLLIATVIYYYFQKHFQKVKGRNRLSIILLALVVAYLTLFNLLQTKWLAYSISYLAYLIYLLSYQYNDKKSNILLVISGIVTGLAILAKINCGTYLFIGIILGLLSELLLSKNKKYEFKRLDRFIYYSLPVVTCIALYLIVHYNHLSALIDQVITFPGRDLGQHRIISFAYRQDDFWQLFKDFIPIYFTVTFPLIWFHLQLVKIHQKLQSQIFIPLYIAIAILPLLLIAEFQSPNLLPKLFIFPLMGVILCQLLIQAITPEQFATVCTYALYLHYYLSRSDNSHYAPLVFLAIILIFGELLQNYPRKFPRIYPRRYWFSWLFFLVCVQLSVPWQEIQAKFLNFEQIVHSGQVFQVKDTLMAQGDTKFLMSTPLPLSEPEAKLYPDQAELTALQFVYQHTTKDDYVYIGVTDHSQIYVSNMKPYWELGRKIGVTNYPLEPGFTTERRVQENMVAQLQANHVRWIVLWQQPEAEVDFASRNYIGSNLLDRYIHRNYSLVRKIGDYEIYSKVTARS